MAMFGQMMNNEFGAEVFKTWSEEQRKSEIGKLVEGFRNGVPVGVLCKMSETIAGNRKLAKKYLKQFMNESERQAVVDAQTGGMLPLVKSFML
jgi:L-fucose isomerase-like protein